MREIESNSHFHFEMGMTLPLGNSGWIWSVINDYTRDTYLISQGVNYCAGLQHGEDEPNIEYNGFKICTTEIINF